MPELPELGRRAPEDEARPPSRSRAARAVPCPASCTGGRCARRTRPGSRAGAARASWRPPCAAHVHEHAERPVAERPRLPAGERGRDVARPRAGPGGSRAGRSAATGARRRLAGSGTAAASPIAHTLSLALDAHVGVGLDPVALAERQTELLHHAGRAHARGPAHQVGRHALAGRQRARSRSSMLSSVVPVRISMPRRRSSRAATSARLSGISRMIRSCASTRIQRVPTIRQRGYGRSRRST